MKPEKQSRVVWQREDCAEVKRVYKTARWARIKFATIIWNEHINGRFLATDMPKLSEAELREVSEWSDGLHEHLQPLEFIRLEQRDIQVGEWHTIVLSPIDQAWAAINVITKELSPKDCAAFHADMGEAFKKRSEKLKEDEMIW